MIIVCTNPSCLTKLSIDDKALKPGENKFKCPKCHSIITLNNGATIIPGPIPQSESKPGCIVVEENSLTLSQKLQLEAGINIIGRKSTDQKANLVIDTEDKTISRAHFKIEVAKVHGRLIHYISDNNSTNKTWLNGKALDPIDSLALKHGDIIRVGKTTLRFEEITSNAEKTNVL